MEIIIYKCEGFNYVSGYDLSRINDISMGVDSLFGFYKIDKGFIDTLKEKGYDIKYKDMELSEMARIRNNYFDEHGDMLNRMKNSSISDLYEWKNNMESYRNDPVFDEDSYDELLEEIARRETKKKEDDELRRDFLPVLQKILQELQKGDVNHNAVKDDILVLSQIIKPYMEDKEDVKAK